MIVWVSYAPSFVTTGAATIRRGTVGRHDPRARPRALRAHFGVDDSEMVVWAETAAAQFDTGGRYNPAGKGWRR